MKIYYFNDNLNKMIFDRIKRKKWHWQFLASGEAAESPMNQWNVTFFLGNTKDRHFWALKHREWYHRIVVIANLETEKAENISFIAKQMLNYYRSWGGNYI